MELAITAFIRARTTTLLQSIFLWLVILGRTNPGYDQWIQINQLPYRTYNHPTEITELTPVAASHHHRGHEPLAASSPVPIQYHHGHHPATGSSESAMMGSGSAVGHHHCSENRSPEPNNHTSANHALPGSPAAAPVGIQQSPTRSGSTGAWTPLTPPQQSSHIWKLWYGAVGTVTVRYFTPRYFTPRYWLQRCR